MSTKIKHVLKLCRIDSSLIAAVVVLVPLLANGVSIVDAFVYALSVLIISMLTFAINDINDLEEDKLNHPSRPLPNKDISELFAVVFFFLLLIFVLFIVYSKVRYEHQYIFYFFIISSLSYHYVKTHLYYLKTFYVGLITCIPLFIINTKIDLGDIYYQIIFCNFLYITTREFIMDTIDYDGDKKSIVNSSNSRTIQVASFVIQSLSLLLIFSICNQLFDYFILALTMITQAWIVKLWFIDCEKLWSIHAMKVNMLLILYFII